MNLASNSIDDQILNRKIFEEFSGFFCRNNFKDFNGRGAIYIFVSEKSVNRLVGKSCILKIGETKNLRKRMANYFRVKSPEEIVHKSGRQTAFRLRNYLDNHGDTFKLYVKYCDQAELLKSKEKDLLTMYLNYHYEVPPLNMGLK